jgi:hypothetical protein
LWRWLCNDEKFSFDLGEICSQNLPRSLLKGEEEARIGRISVIIMCFTSYNLKFFGTLSVILSEMPRGKIRRITRINYIMSYVCHVYLSLFPWLVPSSNGAMERESFMLTRVNIKLESKRKESPLDVLNIIRLFQSLGQSKIFCEFIAFAQC